MRLVENWKKLYKSWSMWCMAAIFALLAIPDFLPMFAAYIPEDWIKWIALVGMVARMIKQGHDDANR